MSKLIEFPKQNPESDTPNYAGHLLMLDLTKARKWQCFNFFLGSRNKISVVPETASMDRIHAAVQAGILLDVTEHPELFVPEKPIAEVTAQDTGKKVYSGTVKFFHDLNIFEEGYKPSDSDCLDEVVAYSTDNPEEQRRIEEALAAAPVVQSPPVSMEDARQRIRRSLLVLPIGTDSPEKYLLHEVTQR
jgi:hypothetical protein